MDRIFKIRCSQIGQIMSKGKKEGELSQTCKSYLHAWYANDKEEIYSKYFNKGIEVENDLIDFMADVLGFGLAEKNKVRLHEDWIEGECDVNLPNCVVDVKASWNKTTLHKQILEGIDINYRWQLVGYCFLYKKPKAILFYGLMNTPSTDYEDEVVYEDLPPNERWVAYEVIPTQKDFDDIKERVLKCRDYLKEYDILIKSQLGKIINE
jgi:hypothetical protein